MTATVEISLAVATAIVTSSIGAIATTQLIGAQLEALPVCISEPLPEPPTGRAPLNPLPGLDQFLGQEET